MGEYTDIGSLSTDIPKGTDQLSQADDHMRGIKTALKNTFPNALGVVNASADELNAMVDYAYGDLNVEDRFAAIELKTDHVSEAQMVSLGTLDTSVNMETRFTAIEDVLGDVTAVEIDGLDGYNIVNGTIEVRLVELATTVNQIIGSPPPPNDVSLSSLYWSIIDIGIWRDARTDAATNNQLIAIRSFDGEDLPLGYNNDLGSDFNLIANKVSYLEYLVGDGVNPGLITWMSLKANLFGGDGGINITNVEGSTERFGFIMKGLEPNSVVDFRFYVDDGNEWGGWCSAVNSNKLIMTSSTGEAFCDLTLGGTNDFFGLGGGRLPETGTGRIQVEGLYYDVNGHVVKSIQNMYCVFY